jgi:MraZ protein
MTFFGSFLFQLDEKGRLSLPAAYRREAGEQPFVLLQVHPPALTLYPQSVWRSVAEDLRGLQRQDRRSRLLVLKLLANAVEATPDGHGRILVPARLQEAAGLQGQALLVGGIDKIEIWNPQTFEQDATDAADFTEKLEKIFP